MRLPPWTFAAILIGSLPVAQGFEGDGLIYHAEQVPWAHWQGRLTLGAATPNWRASLAGPLQNPGLKVDSLSLMADYYFTGPLGGPRSAGGFRATSGIVFGPRAQFWGNQLPASTSGPFSVDRRVFGPRAPLFAGDDTLEAPAVPYLGVGYTGVATHGGWSFSADLGLISLKPGNSVRFGRPAYGPQSLDDAMREMRLSPVLQFGVSYAF